MYVKVYSILNLTIDNACNNSHPFNQRFVGYSHARTEEFYDNVGAASYISLSNSFGYYILVNDNVDQLMQYRSVPSKVISGLWVID